MIRTATASGASPRMRRTIQSGLAGHNVSAEYTTQKTNVVGGWYRKASEATAPAPRSRPCAARPMAHISSGTANPRGTGSYSKVSTVGPAIVAPRVNTEATASACHRPSPTEVAIRKTPRIPSARQATCCAASTAWKSAPVSRRNPSVTSS